MEKLDWRRAIKEHRNGLLFAGVVIAAFLIVALLSAAISGKSVLIVVGLFAAFWSNRLLTDLESTRCFCGKVIPPHHAFCFACGERNPHNKAKK